MNAKAIHNLKKSLPTILKVILGIIAILYIWLVIFEAQSTDASETINTINSISYREWFRGSKEMGEKIIKSLTILIPVGLLITAVLYGTRWKEQSKLFLVAGLSIVLSIIQFIFVFGTFDLIKLINNLIGGCIGYGLYRLLQNLLDIFRKKWKGTLPRRRVLSGWLCILIGLLCLLNGADVNNTVKMESTLQSSYTQSDINTIDSFAVAKEPGFQVNKENRIDTNKVVGDSFKWEFVFQLDSVEIDNDILVLEGFTFVLNKEAEYYNSYNPEIVLRDEEGSTRIILETEYGIERNDVNKYFLCEYNYSKSGFVASIPIQDIDLRHEYEVFIRFGNNFTSRTDTYITGTNIHYAPVDFFIAPETKLTDLDIITRDGILRVYRPDQYCWIYQYEDSLYWIVDDGFSFDNTGYNLLPTHKSGFTHIPYHLRTTQVSKLPYNTEEKMYNNDIFFEEQEITNDIDCGKYRVMKENLTSDFSISCIQTGVYINLSYVWAQYFWPYYVFSN